MPTTRKLTEVKRSSDEKRTLSVQVSRDHMDAHILVRRKSPDVSITEGDIREFLESAEIAYGVDERVLVAVVKKFSSSDILELGLLRIASGDDSVPGENGKVVYENPPTGHVATQTEADAENVDFKEVRTFSNVMPGDLIGKHIPPKPGTAGSDVFGRVIPVADVEDDCPEAGQSVIFDEETREFRAECRGHVLLDGGLLRVSPVFEIEEDVGMRIGNIRFVGRVEVGRDIPDDFEVAGEEGVVVGGGAEACVIESGTDVVIRGGMAGKEKGRIRAKGTVRANYLDGVQVVADGDVVVEREIINSSVFTLGRLLIPEGVVIGGDVVSLKGVVAGEIGSDVGTKTSVSVGLDYQLIDELREIHHELSALLEKQRLAMRDLGPKLERALELHNVEHHVKEDIDLLWREVHSMHQRIRHLEKRSEEVSASFMADAVPRIEVRKTVHPGVVFLTGKYEFECQDAFAGPLVVVADEERKRVHIESGTPTGPSVLDTPVPPPSWEIAPDDASEGDDAHA